MHAEILITLLCGRVYLPVSQGNFVQKKVWLNALTLPASFSSSDDALERQISGLDSSEVIHMGK